MTRQDRELRDGGLYDIAVRNLMLVLVILILGSPLAGCGTQSRPSDVAIQEAMVHYKNRRYEQAANAFSRAIELDGKNPNAYFKRARAWYSLEKYEQSVADLNEVIRRRPRSAAAY